MIGAHDEPQSLLNFEPKDPSLFLDDRYSNVSHAHDGWLNQLDWEIRFGRVVMLLLLGGVIWVGFATHWIEPVFTIAAIIFCILCLVGEQ